LSFALNILPDSIDWVDFFNATLFDPMAFKCVLLLLNLRVRVQVLDGNTTFYAAKSVALPIDLLQ
jgi:hypothetical protein